MELDRLGTAGRRGVRCARVDLNLPARRISHSAGDAGLQLSRSTPRRPMDHQTPGAAELQNFTLTAAEM
jgi:hypothetical protein